MYKLLLVTDKADIRALYRSYPDWEAQGFERPEIAENAGEGIEKLAASRFDAVSWLLPVDEGKRFFAGLSRRPEMMGMETVRDEAKLRREISNARRVLASKDAGKERRPEDDVTEALQGEFFCSLIRGTGYTREEIDERFRTLKIMTLRPEWPVSAASFRLPQGDYFLSEVWRYGRERLENALKNVFESESQDASFYLLMINPHHMRLLALPRRKMTVDEIHGQLLLQLSHAASLMSQVFELDMTVRRTYVYGSLYALGEENAERVAH